MHVHPAGVECQLPPASDLGQLPCVFNCLGLQRLVMRDTDDYRDSHDTIQKGTNNCEIAAISIITLPVFYVNFIA